MTKLPGRTGNPEGNTRQGKVGLKSVNFFLLKHLQRCFFFLETYLLGMDPYGYKLKIRLFI